MRMFIVCGGSAGRAVIIGRSETEPEAGKPFRLADARMVLYWARECGGLLGLAANGPNGGTRITHPIPSLSDEMAHQVLAVSEAAALAIDAWRSA